MRSRSDEHAEPDKHFGRVSSAVDGLRNKKERVAVMPSSLL
jgi:hypothetical protein